MELQYSEKREIRTTTVPGLESGIIEKFGDGVLIVSGPSGKRTTK
jgi:hypothetical protein